MMAHCGDSEDQLLLDTPTKMADRFVSWLQKLSANLSKPGPEMAILVIDRVDLVTVSKKGFTSCVDFHMYYVSEWSAGYNTSGCGSP